MTICQVFLISIIVSLVLQAFNTLATDIVVFSDSACQVSYQRLHALNGYPDGICSKLNAQGPYNSFMVVEKDQDCTVTIYGSDTSELTCSSTVLEFADSFKCYNSSWIYYSVDSCTPPNSTNTTSTSTPPLSTPTPGLLTPIPGPQRKASHTGAIIAGGVVGGVIGFLIIAGLVGYFLVWRRRRARATMQQNFGAQRSEKPPPELMSSDVNELPASITQFEGLNVISELEGTLGTRETEMPRKSDSGEIVRVE